MSIFLVDIQCQQFEQFDHIKNKNILYHGKDCMKKFCEPLREHQKNTTDFEKKKNTAVNNKRIKSHQDAK